MRKLCVTAMLVLLLLGTAPPVFQERKASGAKAEGQLSPVVAGNTAFAIDLYHQLRKQEGNLICSPINVSAALTMAHLGARGQTAADMAAVLHLPTDRENVHKEMGDLFGELRRRKKVTLKFANALWGQIGYPLVPAFIRKLKTDYGAEFHRADFIIARALARRAINRWGAKHTNNRIKECMPPGMLDRETGLVLASAIYFKGKWVTRFQEDWTEDAPFHLSKDKTVMVPMMGTTEAAFRAVATPEFQAVELPYRGREISMVIFLPNEVDGLSALEEKLTPHNLTKCLDGLAATNLQIWMPRFSIRSQLALDGPLKDMGMGRAYDRGRADFSGITPSKEPFFIQHVVQSAFIEVDEKGTEAGAITTVSFGCAAHASPVFCADHPFLYLIRDNKTGSILFLGRVVNPNG